jgi:uncharacterized delta-60 repeat protein
VVGGRTGYFTLARYLNDGSLDPSFGSGGIVRTPEFPDEVAALTLGSDGSIVIAGYECCAFVKVFILARYLGDGSLDPSFGDGGVVRTPVSSPSSHRGEPYALALLPDGRIAAGGLSEVGDPLTMVFTLAQYLNDGSLDPSFGTGGIVQTPIGAGSSGILALALQSDGSLVAGGFSVITDHYAFGLARYLGDGSLDPSFGTAGIVQTDVGPSGLTTVHSLALQPDGAIVAGGNSGSFDGEVFTLTRYFSDGTLDLSFGASGIVQTPIGDSAIISSIALQPDGSIVAGGGSGAQFLTPKGFTLARYLGDGSLDPSFGLGGIVVTPIDQYAHLYSLALQPDGKIVAAGDDGSIGNYVNLARYIGAPDSSTAPGGAAAASSRLVSRPR